MTDGTLHSLAMYQIRSWCSAKVDHHAMYVWALEQAAASPSFYLFNLRYGEVDFFEKICAGSNSLSNPYFARACEFRKLFNMALSRRPLDKEFVFALDVGDEAPASRCYPVFTFQKKRDSQNILVPDVEIMTTDFFAEIPPDHLSFQEKKVGASFVGSTTGGGLIDHPALDTNSVPRIRAARFFKNSASVDFKLTSLVQCASESVERRLKAEGFGGLRAEWDFTYASKFGISIDGNGAACSRPAVLLRSRCAMVKYKSENDLYYFPIMKDGRHYISVENDAQLEDIIRQETVEPCVYAAIADQGRSFAERYLHKNAVLDYVSILMKAYRERLHS